MKIFFISKTYLSKLSFNQLIEISKLGAEVHLVTPSHWGKQKVEYNYKEKEGVYIHFLERYFNGNNHLCINKKGLRKILQKVPFDIIHLDEEPYSLISFQCANIIREFKKPFVFFSWQNIYKSYPLPFCMIEKFVYKYSVGAVAGSNDAKNVLLKKGYKKPIVVSSNVGVDINSYKKVDVEELKNRFNLNNKIVIGYVGRLVKEKGIYILLKAFLRIYKNFKDIVLIYIGSGPEQKNLIRIIKNSNLTEVVYVINFISSTQLICYYSLIDILVLPSFEYKNKFFFWKGWKEQFGRVLIEAMASEVAVVGSSCGEIPNVVGDAGLIFKEKDDLDLSCKIKTLLTNRALRDLISKKGRERVLKNYSCQVIAKQLFDFYSKVLNKHYENTY
ncbi:MAG: glycosyltransferase family 4 protein [Candidatus Aenigmarchaeota archaeon]|nr:glycosyltransferase family 4 protein [Candidatus Aenigmarchaeota archaeon]MDW8149103.1 glycosyltransferase family 4 protein [Candidatus Aenigmarchaeota archaeon]